MIDARRVALVGIFHLRLHAGRAEIHFGADTGIAQRLRHFLVAGDLSLIHDEDDDGPERGLRFGADQRQRRLQARDADREAGCRNFLAREARDEIVVTSAAADRAEADGLAVIAFDLERQLGFEHRAGVVFEAADDRRSRFDYASVVITGRLANCSHPSKFDSPSLPSLDSLQFQSATS